MVKIVQSSTNKPTIKIIRNLLPPKSCPYLEDDEGHLSYMGQILMQLNRGIKLKVKQKPVRLVSDLNVPIQHFTRSCRGKLVQTDLCSTIVDMRPTPENEERLARMLAEVCTITFSNSGE